MIEIERKFLIRSRDWGAPTSSRRIEQGYVFIADDRTMRVRRSGETYSMALKVSIEGITRHEVEFPVDAAKGQRMLDLLCVEAPIQKTRHVIGFAGKDWEVDIFDGANAGLVVAEVELASEDEEVALPPWIGPEVTDDGRFFNAALSQAPFGDWGVSYEELLAEKGGA